MPARQSPYKNVPMRTWKYLSDQPHSDHSPLNKKTDESLIAFYEQLFNDIDLFKELYLNPKKNTLIPSIFKGDIERFKNESSILLASLILVQCKKNKAALYLDTLDQIAEAIQNKKLKRKIVRDLLGSGKIDKAIIPQAMKMLFSSNNEKNSLLLMAKCGELHRGNRIQVETLIREGSNPNMTLPDGSKLIDHAKDHETRLLLIEHGAKITKTILNTCTTLQSNDLKGAAKAHERGETGIILETLIVQGTQDSSSSDVKIPVSPRETAKRFLYDLQKYIFNKDTKWSVRKGGGEAVFLQETVAGRRQIVAGSDKLVPNGVKRILDVIEDAKIKSQQQFNTSAWTDALQEIKMIARTRANYSGIQIFFFGQDPETKSWYADVEDKIAKIQEAIELYYTSQNPIV